MSCLGILYGLRRGLMCMLLTTLFLACEKSEPAPVEKLPDYGYFYLDGEPMPINSFSLELGQEYTTLTITPLENHINPTTYIKIGVKNSLLGVQLNLEVCSNSNEYIFIYEDPLYLYSAERSLRSGSIELDVEDGEVNNVRVNAILFDGRPILYERSNLQKVTI